MDDFDDDIEFDEHGLPINPDWYTDDDEDEEYDEYDSDYDEPQRKKKKKDQNDKDTNRKSNKNENDIDPNKRPADKDSPFDKKNDPTKSTDAKPDNKLKQSADAVKEKAKDVAGAAKNTAKAAAESAKAGIKAAAEAVKAAVVKVAAIIAPYIGWILLALLIIILIVVVIIAIVAAAGAIAHKLDPQSMTSNAYITSEHFYGTRVVYIDDEQLSNSLQLSYKQYVIDVVENFEQNNPNIDITISLPSLNDGQSIDNSTALDVNIQNMSLGIANIVANASSAYTNIEFSQLYPHINCFGLNATQYSAVVDFITNYIILNNLYSTADTVNMAQLIASTLSADSDLQYMRVQYQKVMIKDELATSAGLENIEQRQYIASIYMPNKNIDINRVSYTVVNQNENPTTSIKLIERNNGEEITHLDDTLSESDTKVFNGFTLGKVSLNTFESINTQNKTLFMSGLSLFDAIRALPSDIEYFEKDASTGIYTWKPIDQSVLYLEFSTNSKFIFAEFDMNVKSVS